MKKIALFLTLFSLALIPHSVMAKSYTWHNPDFGFSLKFPDHWKMQGGLVPEQEIRVLSPQSQAQCAFEASQDRRFLVYPRRFDKEILSNEFNWDYWEDVTSIYEDRFFHFDKIGSLGRGDARYTVVDYITNDENAQAKRELIYASIYGDMYFVARCVTDQHLYDDFADTFMGMIGSIDFEPAYSAYRNGYYRDFLGNGYKKPQEPNIFTKTLMDWKKRRIYTAQ